MYNKPNKTKINTDSKTDLKKSHTIAEQYKF